MNSPAGDTGVMAPDELIDPLLGLVVTVQRVQPFQATKSYVCPGCGHEIAERTGHVVVVPPEAPELRRHWHSSCWEHRSRRRPGR